MILRHSWASLTALSIMATTSKEQIILTQYLRKAMDIYDELMKRPDYDHNIHSFKACC